MHNTIIAFIVRLLFIVVGIEGRFINYVVISWTLIDH